MRTTALLLMILLPAVAFAETFEETRHLELAAKDIKTLKIYCGSGFLTVIGAHGIDRISATGHIEVRDIAENEFQNYLQNQLQLSLKKMGNYAVLRADFKNSIQRAIEAKIDLTVIVPHALNVTIDDGTGPIIVTSLSSALQITDDSGKIDIINMQGDIKIKDGSGGINIQDVRGNVEVHDGSGEIKIGPIKGNVGITDASGSMTIQDIDGNVTVTDDSGSIEIYQVTQNVFIRQAGSGSLEIEGVKGKVITREGI
ncbi:MAG: hypothetical protein P8X68_20980 [Desulfobacterales bacterium]|jgi:hypothetical protein